MELQEKYEEIAKTVFEHFISNNQSATKITRAQFQHAVVEAGVALPTGIATSIVWDRVRELVLKKGITQHKTVSAYMIWADEVGGLSIR